MMSQSKGFCSRFSILISLMITVGICGCLSEIEIDIPENTSDSIAISSVLRQGNPATINVNITKLASFIGFDLAEPIVGATVTLFDEDGNGQIITEVDDGRFKDLVTDLDVVAGKSYQLKVSTNGKTYESRFERLTEAPKANQIRHRSITRAELNITNNIVDNRYVQFYIDTPLSTTNSNEKVYLKWDFDAVYRFIETTLESAFPPNAKTCYNSQLLNLDKVVIFNGPESRKDNLEEEYLLEEFLDFRFARGFYLNVYQQTLSEGAYEYWEQIQAISDLSGSFFENPPGKVQGNFINVNDDQEEVFGFFYATDIDTVRVLVEPKDYNAFPICPATGLRTDEMIRASCWDCLMAPNSTLEKPSYWID